MSTRREKYYKRIFLAAGIYDTALGIVFTFFHQYPFRWLRIELPNSAAYITLIGVFLFVIGIAYFFIYFGELRRNRDLIVVGTLYKAAYSGVAFYYLAVGDIPHILFALAFGVIDIVFLVLFVECLAYLRRNPL